MDNAQGRIILTTFTVSSSLIYTISNMDVVALTSA